jgi:hypothetical protein
MSGELLKIDKLPTLSEFRFILLEVLDKDESIPLFDLYSICKGRSLNLALSFEHTMKFLKVMCLIDVLEDDRVRRNLSNAEALRSDYHLCIYMTKEFIALIERSGELHKIFNSRVIKFDVNKDSFSINVNSIPLSFPLIKLFLLNVGMAYPDKNTNSKLLINHIYKQFFIDEVLSKVLDGGSTLDLDLTPVPKDREEELKITSTMPGVNVFISYSHKDELIKEELENHFSGLRRNGLINDWNDRMIQAGDLWEAEIKEKLNNAEIVIFLVSSDFMASNYIHNVEIKNAMERHNSSLIKIIPVIARPCDFASLPISNIQALPKNAKAITLWENKDEAYLDVVNQFKKLLASKSFISIQLHQRNY